MDDFSSDVTTTGRLTLDGLSFGTIEESGDTDWFEVELVEGVAFSIQVLGLGVYNRTLYEAQLRLLDENGELFAAATPPVPIIPQRNGYSRADEDPGTYYVEVKGFLGATGTYALEYLQMVPETGSSRADATELTLGASVGAVDNSTVYNFPRVGTDVPDFDWFFMDLDGNQSYVIEIDGDRFFPSRLRSATSQVFDQDGEMIGSSAVVDDGFGNQDIIRFETGAAGRYDLEVRSVDGRDEHYSVALKSLVAVSGTDGADWQVVPSNMEAVPGSISGGAGEDMISFAGRERLGVLVNLDSGLVQAEMPGFISLIMDSIEHVTGSSHGDTLYGAEGGERMRALGGWDMVYGSAGRDTLDGGGGRDTLSYLFSDTGVQVSLLRGRGWTGDVAGDRIDGFETLIGSYHDDFLWGDHGNNRLEGSTGDDTIVGAGGDDYILAGQGTDVIVYLGNRADYEIIQDGIRTDVISDGWEGHDIIGHAEVLRFADGDVVL
ncbi:hypothetical protein SAMN04488012_11710 [Palleronia salina]|uniref:Hemolysin-type calcium-binding repeat-containing protein n=1 Tax=Palleronia salina TaxID=313368 RepID=A0A1M6LQ51_9RHOB|nr:calcium-binding protein [Palleronia salina]SHJ73301.1 hypothetical protein SAMN04488012_11710 [Palleronia salina]